MPGYARRLSMEAAEQLVEPHGILLTTDADGQVDRNWIALNLQALARGADAVAGRVEIDPLDAALIPPKLHEDDARECFYGELLDRISAELDPDPFDRLPRHSEHSGASIAVSVSAYRCAGRIPAIPMGEDRAFFAALRRIDARIRHAPEVRVIVSGRTIGRAVGGMADTIRRRLIKADDTADDQFEPALPAARRAQLRRLARVVWSNPVESEVDLLAKQLLISPSKVKRALATQQPVVKVGDDSMDRQNRLAVLQCGAWRWEPDRVSKRRCGSRPRSCQSRRGIRSTRG